MDEIYKNAVGYEGYYKISNLGNVKTVKRIVNKWDGFRTVPSKILKHQIHKKTKYLFVDLCKKGIKKKYLIHRLVAKAFIDNPNNKPQVNHKDTNRQNNIINNLEWCTAEENMHHSRISKKVIQKDLKGNLIAKFKSTNQASKKTGVNRTYISRCCNNTQKYIKEYYFEFI